MVRIDITALLCICFPLILGAPVDEILKQQIASGLYRNANDDSPYWSPEYLNEESQQQLLPPGAFTVRTRGALDSLGRGNILRSLNNLGGEWGDSKSSGWRFGAAAPPKRGGSLDSLGRGNILRHVNYDDEVAQILHSLAMTPSSNVLRSLDSLGKGNILKRSVRVENAGESPASKNA